jgi:hypothetical protein
VKHFGRSTFTHISQSNIPILIFFYARHFVFIHDSPGLVLVPDKNCLLQAGQVIVRGRVVAVKQPCDYQDCVSDDGGSDDTIEYTIDTPTIRPDDPQYYTTEYYTTDDASDESEAAFGHVLILRETWLV